MTTRTRASAPGAQPRAVLALAGRRIDDSADPSDPVFPLEHVALVASRLRTVFRTLRAGTLVCSAANGADLTALQVARELGMRRRIVLPFSIARFRSVSVVDRPGGALWGWLFDDLVDEARATRNLVVLRQRGTDGDAFDAVNARIIDEAARCAERERAGSPTGVVVWDGVSRGAGDASETFAGQVRDAGFALHTVRVGA